MKNLIRQIFPALSLVSLALLALATPSLALEASPSASLQDKIKNLETEIASKASQIKSQITQKIQNKAYSGTILSQDDSQISLDSGNGKRTMLINQYTNYFTESKKPIKGVKTGDFIVALGDVDDKNNLVAKKIIKTSKPDFSPPSYLMCKVMSINSSSFNCLGKNNQTQLVATSSNTLYQAGLREASASALESNRFIIATGELDNKKVFLARFIYLTPNKGDLDNFSKSASESATPSASVKGK